MTKNNWDIKGEKYKDTGLSEVEKYYIRKYEKGFNESWEDFWKRVDRCLILRGRERRRHAVRKGDVYRTS